MAERETARVSVKDYLAKQTAEVRAIIERARKTIRSADASLEEKAYRTWPLRYGTKHGDVLALGGYSRYASLGFFKGAQLDDPDRILEGTGKGLRHVKLRTPADADRADVKRMIRRAIRAGGVSSAMDRR